MNEGFICQKCGTTFQTLREAATCPHKQHSEGPYGVLSHLPKEEQEKSQ